MVSIVSLNLLILLVNLMVVVFVSYLDGGVDTVTAFLRSLGVVTVVSQTGGHTTIQLNRKETYRH